MCKHQVFWFPVFLICSIAFFDTGASRIPLGSKLSVAKHDYWISPDGNFAFGFFNRSDQPNRFGVGIRYRSRSPSRPLSGLPGLMFLLDMIHFFNSTGPEILFSSTLPRELRSGGATLAIPLFLGPVSATTEILFSRTFTKMLFGRALILHQTRFFQVRTSPPSRYMLRAASSNFVSSHYSLFMDASGQLRLSWETNVIYWKTEATSSEPILAAEGAFQLLDMRSRPV